MTEERITEIETPSGDTHTHTTVITDGAAPRSGGGSGWLIAIVLLIAVVLGFVFFSDMAGSEKSKDNAVAEAAQSVGDAANKVGDAADKAVDEIQK